MLLLYIIIFKSVQITEQVIQMEKNLTFVNVDQIQLVINVK